jgi:hypothetical protein
VVVVRIKKVRIGDTSLDVNLVHRNFLRDSTKVVPLPTAGGNVMSYQKEIVSAPL